MVVSDRGMCVCLHLFLSIKQKLKVDLVLLRVEAVFKYISQTEFPRCVSTVRVLTQNQKQRAMYSGTGHTDS